MLTVLIGPGASGRHGQGMVCPAASLRAGPGSRVAVASHRDRVRPGGGPPRHRGAVAPGGRPRHEPGHLVVGVADHAVRPRLRQPGDHPGAGRRRVRAGRPLRRQRAPRADRARCHPRARPTRRPRRRGRRVLPPQRDQPAGDPAGRGQHRPGAHAGREHHHPAAGQAQLHRQPAQPVPQVPGGLLRQRPRRALQQRRPPAALPQPGLLRRGRLRHLLRGPFLLRRRPGPAHPGAGRHAGRQDPGPQPARPPFEARRGARTARSGPAGNGAAPLADPHRSRHRLGRADEPHPAAAAGSQPGPPLRRLHQARSQPAR